MSEIEKKSRGVSLIIFAGVILGLIGGLYLHFSPTKHQTFNALTVLSYEASQIEKENDSSRLEMPTSSMDEVSIFLEKEEKLLGFKTTLRVFKHSEWALDGASIIDYEFAKISLLQFHKGPHKKLFYFNFIASLGTWPKLSPPQEKSGVFYETVSSQDFNMVLWTTPDGIAHLLIGRSGMEDLMRLVE